VDFKADDNSSPEDLYADLSDVFKLEFNMDVDSYQMGNSFTHIKD